LYAEDSIDMLKTSGIDFERFEKYGIDIQYFGELLMMSGLVLNQDVKWLTFHSSFDFGYLLKTLTCCELPADESSFMELFHTYFPCAYDIKFMMVSVEGLYGGLAALADTLEVVRIGPMHQAGSDSLLTSQTYFKLVQKHFVSNKAYAALTSADANPQYDDSK
jgi:CCR4-NOT transcription complex subunit 7/8